MLFCRSVGFATVVGIACSTAWYFLVNKSRRDNYAEFYKTYDAKADFERMQAAGIFKYKKRIEEAKEAAEE